MGGRRKRGDGVENPVAAVNGWKQPTPSASQGYSTKVLVRVKENPRRMTPCVGTRQKLSVWTG